MHINCLELLAGVFAIQSFTRDHAVLYVRLKMDNRSALSYIKRLGGPKSVVLSNLAVSPWHWALERQMILSVDHLLGTPNQIADWESRHHLDSSDWKLDTLVFIQVMQTGSMSGRSLHRLHHQLLHFYSWKPDPLVKAVDALHQSWEETHLYSYPPFCLITRVLPKVRENTAEVILITLVWTA